MDINNKVEKIFSYLLAVKNLKDKTVRNIEEYEKVFYKEEIEKLSSCTVNLNDSIEEWISIENKGDSIYNDFSKLYLKLQKNSESLELIYTDAVVVGKVEEMEICHPILTTKLDLKFNDKENKFTLKPYNNKTKVEFEFLSGIIKNISFDNIIELKNKLRERGIDLLNQEDAIDAIKTIGKHLKFTEENIILSPVYSNKEFKVNSEMRIYKCPMIILRKTDTRLWNMELNSMIEALREGCEIPKTIQVLVDSSVKNNANDPQWEDVGQDLLFPLPSNEAQEEIVKRLSQNFGVVVQGPPGTGKSHSIVNLICHLLAHGKRVLVTSQTDRALKVLSDKIPEEIRALCISILGDDSKSLDELDDSVRKIVEQISVDTQELRTNIKNSRLALNKCKEKQKDLFNSLKAIERKENEYFLYDGEKFTLKEVGTFIKENEKNYSWIIDSLKDINCMPLSQGEYEEFLNLSCSISEEKLQDILNVREYIDKFLENKNLHLKIRDINKLQALEDTFKKSVDLWSNEDKVKEKMENRNLHKYLNLASDILSKLDKTWHKKFMDNCYSSQESKDNWRAFSEKCKTYNDRINSLKIDLSSHNINLVGYEDLNKFKEDFLIVSRNINSKGKIGGLFKVMHGKCKYILEECSIDFKPISTKEHVELIGKVIEKSECERALVTYWNNNMCEFGVERLRYSDDTFRVKIQEYIKQIQSILIFEEECVNPIKELLPEELFTRKMDWYKKDSYEIVKLALESILDLERLNSLNKEVEVFIASIPQQGIFKDLHKYIEEGEINKIRDFFLYIDELNELQYKAKRLVNFNEILQNTCSKTLEFVKECISNKEDISKYSNFYMAFKWKKFRDYLDFLQDSSIENVEKNIKIEKEREAQLIKELVTTKSWYNQILRTTEEQKRSLFTWMEAIKRIGKGTGSQAVKYRKLAQKEMENCKDVIPVWIMPINRVIENISPVGELFDVIIVDESSQSDISALTVLMRGKRAVIVGDDRQISPEAIGKDITSVESLIDEYLKDIPHSEWFDLKTSLYNTALRVFPNRLVLKEHFRCVPEIINFSNDNYYSKEIVPLRCASSKENFEEPIKLIKIEDGVRDESKAINIKEAEEIVKTIVKCCKDEKYNDMTMGVISLLGDAQSEYIEELLIKSLGMEEVIRRKLVCGDAYSFQGDERDIMFLSMVIANNVKFTALTKESDERRFNVAASRAKNQMWIFHSVGLEDLNPKCVRYSLLNYAYNYSSSQFTESHIKPILNPFQQDIEKYLLENNYDIISNAKIGKYSLDFVINDNNDTKRKLALMCVGGHEDNYIWEDHYERQMCLERVGWEIFKIRNSEFYSENKIKKFLLKDK